MGYKILEKVKLNENVIKMVIDAPLVSRHAKAGEFIILRPTLDGERIPLTIHDYDRVKGSVTIIYQVVGLTTLKLDRLNVGEEVVDFVGPLGRPTELDDATNPLVIGGGVGSAIAYPICKALKEQGKKVDAILGFRNKDLVILEKEFKDITENTYLYTDDGSYGIKGFVTSDLRELIKKNNYDKVFVIGPVIMMKNVSFITKETATKTLVSMNPLMIDGTGMCGCCRVSVGGKMKFACVDGPDFDASLVDFDELMKRNRMYQDIERKKYDENCHLFQVKK